MIAAFLLTVSALPSFCSAFFERICGFSALRRAWAVGQL
jgi:hypothetical protein